MHVVNLKMLQKHAFDFLNMKKTLNRRVFYFVNLKTLQKHALSFFKSVMLQKDSFHAVNKFKKRFKKVNL